jgi:hypothetical protein
MDLILAKPWATLRELSLMSGYSIAWLSQMIRSDCFQQEYRRRRDGVECGVLQTIEERLQSLTHLAIDRMEEVLVETEDKELVVDAFDRVLHRAGYAPKAKEALAPTLQQNNIYVLQRGELEELRGQILEGSRPTPALPAEVPANDC